MALIRDPRPRAVLIQLAVLGLAVLLAGHAPARRLPRPGVRPAPYAYRPTVARPIPPGPRSAPAPGPNFRISAGASNAAASLNGTDFGNHSGLAFSNGRLLPAWSDNSSALGDNPDLPAFDIASALVTVSGGAPAAGAAINLTSLPGNQSGAVIAANPANPLNLVMAAEPDLFPGLVRAVSDDGGATWAVATIADGADGLPPAYGTPGVAFDSFGNCFLTYLGLPPGGISSVEAALSTDGGLSFSFLSTLGFQVGGVRDVDQPVVTTGPGPSGAGSVWVCWTDFQAGGVIDTAAVVAAGARVNGLGAVQAFGQPQVVPGSGEGNFADAAVGPAGQVMVVYQAPYLDEGPSQILANLDANGLAAGGFGGPVVVSQTNVGGLDVIPAQSFQSIDAEPRLAWDRSGGENHGRLYLSYTDEAVNESGDTNVMLRYTDDAGVSWSPPIRVNDDASGRSQFLPRLAVDQTTGDLALSWYDCRADAGPGSPTDSDGLPNTDAEFWAALVPAPLPSLQFGGAVFTVSEAAGAINVPVTRTGATRGALSVPFAVTGGTATRPADFLLTDGSLAFADRETQRQISLALVSDRLIEASETIDLALGAPSSGGLGSPAAAVVTVTDDRAATAPGSLQASPAGPESIALAWVDNCDNEEGVQVERRDGAAGAFALIGTAPAGSTGFTDADAVAGIAYTYRVRAVRAGLSSDYSNEAGAGITTLQFSAGEYAGAEGESVNVTITRVGDASGTVRVSVAAADGTAVAPDDYQPLAQEVTFGPGIVSRTVAVALLADNLLEEEETFELRLSDPGGSAALGEPDIAAVRIGDDSSRPAPTGLTARVVSAAEIALSWTDNCGNETSFLVERRINGGAYTQIGTTGADVAAFNDAGAAADVAYDYRVRAARGPVASTFSGAASAVIPAGGRAQVSPGRLNFGRARAGVVKRKTLRVKNRGRGALAGVVGGAASPFRLVSGGGPFTLPPRGTLSVVVEFAPEGPGAVQHLLRVSTTDPARSRVDVRLSGAGR